MRGDGGVTGQAGFRAGLALVELGALSHASDADRPESGAELAGEQHRAARDRGNTAFSDCIDVGRGAVSDPADDSLEDGGRTEEVEGEVEVEVADTSSAGVAAIRVDGLLHGQNAAAAKLCVVEAREWTHRDLARGERIGQIRERVAQGRKLPVEHGDDAGLGWMNHEMVELESAVDDADRVVLRNVLGQPFNESLNRADPCRLGASLLLRPSAA